MHINLAPKKRKFILDKSPKKKFCFQHTFQTDFSLFSPLCSELREAVGVMYLSPYTQACGKEAVGATAAIDRAGLDLPGCASVGKAAAGCTEA